MILRGVHVDFVIRFADHDDEVTRVVGVDFHFVTRVVGVGFDVDVVNFGVDAAPHGVLAYVHHDALHDALHDAHAVLNCLLYQYQYQYQHAFLLC